MSLGTIELFATASMLGLFGLVFVLARRLDNYSIVDVAWSYAFGLLTIFYAVAGRGWPPRRLAIAIMVSLWSVRLGTHLAVRVRDHHPREDGRYVTMRQEWGDHLLSRMFRFFQTQALSVIVLAVPFLLIGGNTTTHLTIVEIVGVLVWGIGWAGESVADAQLARFKGDRANAGRVCDVGLWRWSRHPNYFFEWTIWMGYWLIACAVWPWGLATIVSPAIILYLLLRVTGVPLSEAQSLRSRGDAYRRYQQVTSVFLPLPQRRPPTPQSAHGEGSAG